MTGRHIFEPFDILEASQVQSFLQDQAVMRFATTADRFTQLTSPSEGMVTYVLEVGYHEWFNGTDWVPLGRSPYVYLAFDESDTFTKAQHPLATIMKVTCIGGGGGSGGCAETPPAQTAETARRAESAGGGGGGIAVARLEIASLATTEPIVVGAGGLAGAPGANAGATGGTSEFGTAPLCQSTGGDGGGGGAAFGAGEFGIASRGYRGEGTIGDLLIAGGHGGNGVIAETASTPQPSLQNWGGASYWSGPVLASGSNNIAAINGEGPGVGAGGGRNSVNQADRAGGAGASGLVIIELY